MLCTVANRFYKLLSIWRRTVHTSTSGFKHLCYVHAAPRLFMS